jgi:hypothetical protein
MRPSGPTGFLRKVSSLLISIPAICLMIPALGFAAETNKAAPPTAAYVYVGTCPNNCINGGDGSQISGFAVRADGSTQPISGSPFPLASYELSSNSSFLFAVDGLAGQDIFTYAPSSDGSLAQVAIGSGLGSGGCGDGAYVQSISLEPSGHFLYAGDGINDCGTFYTAFSISPGGQLSYVSNPYPFGSFAWGSTLTFSPDGRFAYTGTVAEYAGGLAGFQRDTQGSLTGMSPNAGPPAPPNPSTPLCYVWNSASSSAGYVAVMWWTGLYCNSWPDIAIANYTVNPNGTLALVPNSETIPEINDLENMLYDPSGNYLALAGSIGSGDQHQGAIEIYKLQPDGSLVSTSQAYYLPGVENIAWDDANHLYAYVSGSAGRSPCNGACGLYIFNNNDGVLTPAPGSPYPIQNIVSLAVLPTH